MYLICVKTYHITPLIIWLLGCRQRWQRCLILLHEKILTQRIIYLVIMLEQKLNFKVEFVKGIKRLHQHSIIMRGLLESTYASSYRYNGNTLLWSDFGDRLLKSPLSAPYWTTFRCLQKIDRLVWNYKLERSNCIEFLKASEKIEIWHDLKNCQGSFACLITKLFELSLSFN